jgi:hypothetical protein
LAKRFDRNADTLAPEVLAIKTVIGQVLGRVHQLDPVLSEAIEGGIEDAQSAIREAATRARKGTGAAAIVKAISTVESVREAVLTRSRNPVRRVIANDNR